MIHLGKQWIPDGNYIVHLLFNYINYRRPFCSWNSNCQNECWFQPLTTWQLSLTVVNNVDVLHLEEGIFGLQWSVTLWKQKYSSNTICMKLNRQIVFIHKYVKGEAHLSSFTVWMIRDEELCKFQNPDDPISDIGRNSLFCQIAPSWSQVPYAKLGSAAQIVCKADTQLGTHI